MKRAKLLSLFLAGSLLFQTAGIDAMATAPSEPAAITETAEDTGDDLSEQPSEEESNPGQPAEDEENKDTSENDQNPGQPAEGEEDEDKDTSEDDQNPEQPAEGEGDEDKDTSEDGQNPEQPAEGEEDEDKDTSEDDQNPEQPAEDEEDEDISDEEETEKDTSQEDVENEDSISENTVSENTISENTLPEDEGSIFSIFPGLGEDYVFSSSQLADKRVLASHMGDIVQVQSVETATIADYQDADDSYVSGEVVYLAETKAEAEQVAAAFGGTLDSYSYEVAVISLPKAATVPLAIAAAAEPEIKLPAVWPNYYQYLHEDTNATIDPLDPSDPNFDDQWQHDYIGTRYAWAAGFKGQGIKVAVIDTGIDADHEDLAANAKDGKDFVNGATGTSHADDNQTHGTHVAGIIAADDNNVGGRGIAPDATVSGYCVFPSQGGAQTADVIRAIQAAVANEYDIINMSLGSPQYNADYEKIVKNAYENGVAIFASSGNDDTDGYNFPAAYASTISVGAVNENGTRASFSNYGSTVTLSFPGVEIFSTISNGSYGKMDGTSQASPAAAGTAAVILSARKDIYDKEGKARVDALLSAMKSSTTKCSTSGMGAGTTYLPGVLKLATEMTAPETPVIEVINESTYKRGTNKKDYLAESISVKLSSATAVGVDIYYATNGKTPTYKNGVVTNADTTVPYTLGAPIPLTGAKSKTIKAIAVNPVSGKVSKVASKTVTLTPIPSKVTVEPVGNVTRIAAGKSLKFTATVTQPYAISKNVKWTVTDADGKDAAAKGVTVATNGTVKTTSSKTLKTPAGTYKVTATAVGGTDPKKFDGVSSDPYIFTVIDASTIKKVAFLDAATNKAPAKKSIKAGKKGDSRTADADNKVINLADYLTVTKAGATAKDDTVIKGSAALAEVVWSSSNTKVATVTDGVITAVAPGKATIKATSNDGLNKSASYSVTVVQPVEEIKIDGPKKVAAGKSIALTAKVTPANASNKKLVWTVSGDGKNVSINKGNGKITTKKGATGKYTVTASAADGLLDASGNPAATPATYEIEIATEEITKITVSSKKLTLFPPNTSAAKETVTATLTAKVEGKVGSSTTVSTLTNPLIAWTSSAPSIASVDQTGKVTANGPGKATITCAATDGSNKKATCTVTVTVPMSKLVIGPTDGNDGDVAVGKSIKMAAKYYSNYGTPNNKKISWQIVGYGDSSLDGKVSVNKNNGTVSADKSLKAEDLEALGSKRYVGIQAVAQDGSGVKSNTYLVYIWPNYIAAQIGFSYAKNSYNGDFYIVVTAYKNAKGKPDWSRAVMLPDYCTATVTGPKNSGVIKDINQNTGCALYQPLPPIPRYYTGLYLDDDPGALKKLKVSELAKMSLTIKLKDGSNLTAKANDIYAICYPKKYQDANGNTKTVTTVGYFTVKKVYY